MNRVEVRDTPFTVYAERFRAPVVVHSRCPACGREAHRDLSVRGLAYPSLNAPEVVLFWCECAETWEVSVRLGLTAEVVSAPAGR